MSGSGIWALRESKAGLTAQPYTSALVGAMGFRIFMVFAEGSPPASKVLVTTAKLSLMNPVVC